MARSEALAVQAGEATLAGTLLLPDAPPPADARDRYPNVAAAARRGCLVTAMAPGTASGIASWFAPPAEGERGLLARLAEALAAQRRGEPARRPARLRRLGRRLGVDGALHQDR